MSLLVDTLRPVTLKQVVGNKKVKDTLDIIDNKQSIILWGNPGCGKTTIASIIAPGARVYDATTLTAEAIRSMNGTVVLNEVQGLNKTKQELLLTPIEQGKIQIIGTTTKNPYMLEKALTSRCICLEVKYPEIEEVSSYIIKILMNEDIIISRDDADKIASSDNDMRNVVKRCDMLIRKAIDNIVTVDMINEVCDVVLNGNKTEWLKSALQKSIRGSDVDASLLYADALMKCGELEILCRRLRVIISEDIGLASLTCPSQVNPLLDNALELGMPECRFSILQAVSILALQPKSNSMHEACKVLDRLPSFEVPDYLKLVHSNSYKYPHDYPNHYVEQMYLPSNLEKVKIYNPCNNKTENSFRTYWETIKGK